MEDLKKIQEFFSKPLNENKVTKEDFDKVVKILSKSKYPFTIMLVPKWDEIDIITGQDSPDEIVDDIGQRLDSAGLNWGGNSGITISGDSSNYSRKEYSDIFRVNGGHQDYFEESVNEYKGKMPTQDQVDKFFALTQNETHYLNSKPVAGQEATFNLMKIEPWDEYDLSNWNSLVRKAKTLGKLDETYASSFGGFRKELDGETIENELQTKGYETPRTGIWNKILVKKNGERVAMIDTDESYYIKDGKSYQWSGTEKFIDHVESLNEATEEEENEFHKELDKLVHKTFGHSSDEKKKSMAQELAETIKLGEGVIEEELCPKGKAYIKRRKAAGEKSSAYLSGRAVKVCKGQMSGRKKKK
jgi:hypothetical protein